MIRRAPFLMVAAALAAAALASETPLQTGLTIRADTPGSVINPAIYGQFAEHLGRGIYGGIWVGEDSPIPNTRGYRNDVVAALKELEVPVVRWPGGCFADEYHWRDGIGPREQAADAGQHELGRRVEDNAFGTHEFLDFAELIGADAYVNGNVGTGTPQEMAEWVEYMTSDANSTLADLRRTERPRQALEAALLRRRQRDLGLRRQHAARILRRPVSPLRNLHQDAQRTIGRRKSRAAPTPATPTGPRC